MNFVTTRESSYFSADKEKKENIDLKNQAETLCFEVEKELTNFSAESSSDLQNVRELITKIRANIQEESFTQLKSLTEELKMVIRNLIATQSSSNSNANSNLNDL